MPTDYELARVPIPPALRRVWASLPKLDCKDRCAESCGPWHAARDEVKLLQSVAPRQATTMTCPWLDGERCSVYRLRPTICRLWGMVPSMRCPWGCVPDGGLLPEAAAWALLDRLEAAAGGPDSPWLATDGWPCIWCGHPVAHADRLNPGQAMFHGACAARAKAGARPPPESPGRKTPGSAAKVLR